MVDHQLGIGFRQIGTQRLVFLIKEEIPLAMGKVLEEMLAGGLIDALPLDLLDPGQLPELKHTE